MGRAFWRRAAFTFAAFALLATIIFFATFPALQPAFFAAPIAGVPTSVWIAVAINAAVMGVTTLAAREADGEPTS